MCPEEILHGNLVCIPIEIRLNGCSKRHGILSIACQTCQTYIWTPHISAKSSCNLFSSSACGKSACILPLLLFILYFFLFAILSNQFWIYTSCSFQFYCVIKTNNNNSLSFARRQIFALESKFFSFRKDLFSEGTGVQENKQEVLKK